MKGKLIIIDGCDGSGKATQSKLLENRLREESKKIKRIEFPDYSSESSALVKMYLDGMFGKNAEDVNPYVASTFYAVDRYASFKTKWKDFYENGGIILADRYTTSNMLHQAAKISDTNEKNKFLKWLCDFEYNLFGLPTPDLVIFLDVPPEYTIELMKNRNNKYSGRKDKDIHERNYQFVKESYQNALLVSKEYGWERIECLKNGKMLKIDEIHSIIYEKIMSIF
ncbi:dTMP kinase [Clostridium oryzae]|uniref:Thymidylate kinase n=1 Tax=Clostridium oryzae TaxID=1450648 RepID=A0A1V4IMD3_9CLOT|nr:deoxynucleoside kinase [Clostridium oryzae]OPJ61053.1 thymidylate kinase [Clostridium oryzae]